MSNIFLAESLICFALSLAGFIYGITLTVILIEDHDAAEKGYGESSDSDRVVRWPAIRQRAQGQHNSMTRAARTGTTLARCLPVFCH